MKYLLEMLRQGFQLIGTDPGTMHVVLVHTLQITLWGTLIAFVVGFPIAYWIASRDTAARRAVRTVANIALGLPPVGVGVYWVLADPPIIPFLRDLGGFSLFGEVQAVLSLPMIVALCATALMRLPVGLVDQARAYGASGWRLALLKLREAKVGIVAAVIVAMGAAMGEVGAIVILSMNGIAGSGGTLATEMLYVTNLYPEGPDSYRVEYAIVLLGMLVVLGLALTLLQQSSGRSWRDLRRTRSPMLQEVHA